MNEKINHSLDYHKASPNNRKQIHKPPRIVINDLRRRIRVSKSALFKISDSNTGTTKTGSTGFVQNSSFGTTVSTKKTTGKI